MNDSNMYKLRHYILNLLESNTVHVLRLVHTGLGAEAAKRLSRSNPTWSRRRWISIESLAFAVFRLVKTVFFTEFPEYEGCGDTCGHCFVLVEVWNLVVILDLGLKRTGKIETILLLIN